MKNRWGILLSALFGVGCCLGGGVFAAEKRQEMYDAVREEAVYVTVLEEEDLQNVYAVKKLNIDDEVPLAATENEVTPDAVWVEILGESHASNETELYFNQYQITDLTAFIEALRQFTDLEKVEMYDTNLSNEEMSGLQTMFPNTKFVWNEEEVNIVITGLAKIN